MRVFSLFFCLPLLVASAAAQDSSGFDFQSNQTLEEMQSTVRSLAPLGADRDDVRSIFLGEGGAELFEHPTEARREKYVVDINICRLYIWRWNISADYNRSDELRQIYVNGERVHRRGPNARQWRGNSLMMGFRPRPDADLGESSLSYLANDLDGDMETWEDRTIWGAGPSRMDPSNMGEMHMYNTELWRSIFDHDDVTEMQMFRGDCPTVDEIQAMRDGVPESAEVPTEKPN